MKNDTESLTLVSLIISKPDHIFVVVVLVLLGLVLGLFVFVYLCFETGSHYIAQTSLKLNPPTSASQVLGLQMCTIMPSLDF
jgi:hypothetical protein